MKVPKVQRPVGPIYKHLTKENLEFFHANLIKTREITSQMENSLQRLEGYLEGVNVSGILAGVVDPLKREVRKCKATFEAGITAAQSQEGSASALIEAGHTRDALTAINTGLVALGELDKPFTKLRDRLADALTKSGPVVREGLEALSFDTEVEAWNGSVMQWTASTSVATWSIGNTS